MVLTVTLRAKHPTALTISCPVRIIERRSRRGWTSTSEQHRLIVPPPTAWTIEHVRAVIAALRRFLPPHDPNGASGHVFVEGRRPVRYVNIEVRARGWGAQCLFPPPDLNRVDETLTMRGIEFTEPMIEVFRDLQKASPFAVAKLGDVAADITAQPFQFDPHVEERETATLREIILRRPREQRAAFVRSLQNTIVRASQDADDWDN